MSHLAARVEGSGFISQSEDGKPERIGFFATRTTEEQHARGIVPSDVREQIESEFRDAGIVASSNSKIALVEMIRLDDENSKPGGFTFYKEVPSVMSRIRNFLARFI